MIRTIMMGKRFPTADHDLQFMIGRKGVVIRGLS